MLVEDDELPDEPKLIPGVKTPGVNVLPESRGGMDGERMDGVSKPVLLGKSVPLGNLGLLSGGISDKS